MSTALPVAWEVTRLIRKDKPGRACYLHTTEKKAREDYESWTAWPHAEPTIAPLFRAPETAAPVAPTPAQVNSACMSFRHDFGLMDKTEAESLRCSAKEWLRAWQKEGFVAASQRKQP